MRRSSWIRYVVAALGGLAVKSGRDAVEVANYLAATEAAGTWDPEDADDPAARAKVPAWCAKGVRFLEGGSTWEILAVNAERMACAAREVLYGKLKPDPPRVFAGRTFLAAFRLDEQGNPIDGAA